MKLMNVRNLLLVMGVFTCVWFLSIKLTQQRVQIEAYSKLKNSANQSSAFVWDFDDFETDIVKSFQQYWLFQSSEQSNKQSIIAIKDKKTRLSLNFSSEIVNSQLHNRLFIIGSHSFDTLLKIQFNSEIDGGEYYYSPQIKLTKQKNNIDLNAIQWHSINNKGQPQKRVNWGGENHKIASLVLYFTRHNNLQLDSISLPYSQNEFVEKKYKIGCDGNLLSKIIPKSNDINIITLSEVCLLPSNYLWLKDFVENKYPESILQINNIKPWSTISNHKVNKTYNNIALLNVILYLFITLLLVIVIVIIWPKGAIKVKPLRPLKLLDKKSILSAYANILLPSFIVFILLSLLKPLQYSAFESWFSYFVWAIVQQFILGYLLTERIFYKNTQNKFLASLLAAFVFSVLHLPSVTLFLLTFFASIFWAYNWLIFKRIIPLAISHAFLALMFYHVVPTKILYSKKVLQLFWN